MYGVNQSGILAFGRDVDPPFSKPTMSAPTSSQPCGKIIAVVDDDGLVRASMGNLIRSLGYSVELFASGPSILAEDVGRFACVISDMQMPEMSGLALQSKLSDLAPTLPILFLTAFPDEWARSRALAAGAKAFLEKPCDLDELVGTLEVVAGSPEGMS